MTFKELKFKNYSYLNNKRQAIKGWKKGFSNVRKADTLQNGHVYELENGKKYIYIYSMYNNNFYLHFDSCKLK